MAEKKLTRQCSWCKRIIEQGEPGALISHTVCDACYAERLKDLLDTQEEEEEEE